MDFSKPFRDKAIIVIALYPNNLPAIGDLLDKVEDPLMMWRQSSIRVINDVAVEYKLMILRNISKKALEFSK